MNTLNLCRWHDGRQNHIDPEYIFTSTGWRLEPDMGTVVEVIHRLDGESDLAFHRRARWRASEIESSMD